MQLPLSAQGFSWVPQDSWELMVKSLKPKFVFVESDNFISTNINHRLNKRGISAYVSVSAPLGIVTRKYGWVDALKMTERRKDYQVFEEAAHLVKKTIDQAVLAGADAIVICDDLCGANSPLVHPLFVIGELVPLYTQIADKIKAAGIPAIFHSDGDIREYYPALYDAGFDAVHVAHPSYETTLLMAQAALDRGLSVLGGIVTAHLLERPLEEQVQQAKAFMQLEKTHGSKHSILLCDDGGLQSKEETARVIEIVRSI